MTFLALFFCFPIYKILIGDGLDKKPEKILTTMQAFMYLQVLF